MVSEKRVYDIFEGSPRLGLVEKFSRTGKLLERTPTSPYRFIELNKRPHLPYTNIKELFYYNSLDSLCKQIIIKSNSYNPTTYTLNLDTTILWFYYHDDSLSNIEEIRTVCPKCSNDTIIDITAWKDSMGIKIRTFERKLHTTKYTGVSDDNGYRDTIIKTWQHIPGQFKELYNSLNQMYEKQYFNGKIEHYYYDKRGRISKIELDNKRIDYHYNKRKIKIIYFNKIDVLVNLFIINKYKKNRLVSKKVVFQPGGKKYSTEVTKFYYDKFGNEVKVELKEYNYETKKLEISIQAYEYLYY